MGMADSPKYRPTPAWLVLLLLATTGILFLSEQFQWFPFNAHKGWTVLISVAAVGVIFALMLLWFIVALVFRRRFQFGVRSLLVLVVAVALPLSWLKAEMQAAKKQEETVNALTNAGCQVWFQNDNQLVPSTGGIRSMPSLYSWPFWGPSPGIVSEWPWLLRLFGRHFFYDVEEVDCDPADNRISDRDFAQIVQYLRALPSLKTLTLQLYQLSNDGLSPNGEDVFPLPGSD
jgi:hypothetical protein